MSMLRSQAIVAGVGESRIGKVPGVSALELCAEAARRAIADAGLRPRDIDGLLTAYTMTEPYPVFYGALAEFMGLELRYGAELTAGGGSSGVMIYDAALAVMSGRSSLRTRMTSRRDRPVITETRDVDCLRSLIANSLLATSTKIHLARSANVPYDMPFLSSIRAKGRSSLSTAAYRGFKCFSSINTGL